MLGIPLPTPIQEFYNWINTGLMSASIDASPKEIVKLLELKPDLQALTLWVEKNEEILLNLPKSRKEKKILAAPDCLSSLNLENATFDLTVCTSDIGGTNLRVTVNKYNGDEKETETLDSFEVDLHNECLTLRYGHELEDFIEILADRLIQNGFKSGNALSITWSFPFNAIKRTDGVPGIGCEITDTALLQKYVPFLIRERAEEFDGRRVDELLLSALKKRGAIPSSIVFGNDTSFSRLATLNLDGAFIASTGANGTCIEILNENGEKKFIYCNAEMGSFFLLDPSLLGKAEKEWADLYQRQKGIYPNFESIMSGSLLPSYFDANLRALISKVPYLANWEVNEWFLGCSEIGNPALISALADNDLEKISSEFPQTFALISGEDENSRMRGELFHELSKAIMQRGGLFAGIMGYFTILPLLDIKDQVRVGADSSLAWGCREYRKALSETFDKLTLGKGELVLLPRDGMSPATKGGNNAAVMYAAQNPS